MVSYTLTILLALLPLLVLSSPLSPHARSASSSPSYSIDTSTCSENQLTAIRSGLAGAAALADAAGRHLDARGEDEFYVRWFGTSSDVKELGELYGRMRDGVEGVSFTCADVDGRCTGRPGYQTLSDPNSTVICDTYYGSREPVSGLCDGGSTINDQGTESTQGSFFMHRLLHLPGISGNELKDVVDSAHDAVELAKSDPATAVNNIHSVQYYALDVYASDVLIPGKGCLGDTSVQVEIPDDD